MERSGAMRALSGFEKLLLALGLLLISIYVMVQVFSRVSSHWEMQRFWHGQSTLSSRGSAGNSQTRGEAPDFRLWSEKRIEAYKASLNSAFPPPLGVLRIPGIHLEVPVLQGTDELALNRGVGHIDGTAFPGEAGNVGIAGHRDGFFRGLKNIHEGDAIELSTQNGTDRYLIDEILIVAPEDVSVLQLREKPSLTLVTCFPFYFVGSAPQRFIVHASLINSSGHAESGKSDQSPEKGGGNGKH